MKGLLRDLKHALRLYRRTPGASLVAVAVLAIGMAFVTAFLSLYVDIALKPHPGFENSRGIVTIGLTNGDRLLTPPSTLVERMNDEVRSLEAVVGSRVHQPQFGIDREPVMVEDVTHGFFDALKPKLAIGRGFDFEEHTADAATVAVISYEFWQEKFDSDPDVLGTTIELTGRPQFGQFNASGQTEEPEETTTEFRIIGVMTEELNGLRFDGIDIWIPFERSMPIFMGPIDAANFSTTLFTIGRLAEGASARTASLELTERFQDSDELAMRVGGTTSDFQAEVGLVRNLNVHRESIRQLRVFLVVSVLLALVAACNVSLFLLARAPGRRRELAIRMSVGAPVKRLARQLSREAGLLVIASAIAGLLLSIWLTRFLQGLAFLQGTDWGGADLFNWRVLGLVGVFLLALTLLVSLAPILGLKRLGIAASSRIVSARATPAQRIAGTFQLAVAGTLAGASIAFAWYLGSMIYGYPGFETRDRYVANMNTFLPGSLTTQSMDSMRVGNQRLHDTVSAIAGVSNVSLAGGAPAVTSSMGNRLQHPLDPDQYIQIRMINIDPHYVDVLGLRLLHGRAPEANETNALLINAALAREYFGREDVVGEQLPIRGSTSQQQTQIVGVLEDVAYRHPDAEVEPIAFPSWTEGFFFVSYLIIESQLTEAELQQELEKLVDSNNLEIGLGQIVPLFTLRSRIIAADRARGLLTIATGSLVVLLAAFGFYGTQRYLVAAGRREYAIRASLGGGPAALGRLVFVRGLTMSLPGLAFGTVLSFLTVAWLRDDFVSRSISPAAVTAFVLVGLVLLVMAASIGPALKARKTEPAPLLREE